MEGRKDRQTGKKKEPRVTEGVALKSEDKQKRKQVPEVTLFRSIAEGMRDALVVINADGRIRYWNPACEEIFGYTSEEMTGKSSEAVIPVRYRKDYEMALQDLRRKHGQFSIKRVLESEAIRKDGAEVPIELSVSGISVRGKWHVVCVIRDITQKRRAQEELGETLAKYQLMCNKQKDAIVLVDVETKRFLGVNDAAASMYGFSKEEFMNLRTEEIFLEGDSSTRVQQKPANVFKHRRKDGGIFPVEITGCLFNWKRRETYCAVVRDVSGCVLIEEKEGN